jgi:L-lactate dehydrogenase complex protein LldG
VSAREEILAAVRRATDGADRSEVHVPHSHRGRPSRDGAVDLFVDRVEDYRAVVERCAEAEVAARVAAAVGDATKVLVPEGLAWPVPAGVRDTGFTAHELDGFDAVVTGATLGIAETGTIVLTHGPGEGRRALTLVPDLHVCVIRADQVVRDVPAAVAVLDPTRPQTWVSGPSATSDIELNRVEGVHGPRHLHVIVVHG